VVAMAAMFFVAISIPYAFADEGNAAMVLATAYAVVRLTHLGVYLIAAGDDADLRSVILGMLAVASVMLVLLFAGAAVGGSPQKWWWLAAVVVDQLGVYFVRSTRWRLNSASHFAERFGLVVIIAIGESIVAVGAATSDAQLSTRDGLALLCGLTIAVCLWWLYFDVVALVAEDVLRRATGVERARLARDSYTYVHLLFVGGIVFVALGMVLLVGDHGHVDAGRYALYGGIVCYLVGHLLFRLRNVGSINVGRAVVGVLMLTGIPTLAALSALVQVAVPAVTLAALVAVEVRAFREPRNEIRGRRPSISATSD